MLKNKEKRSIFLPNFIIGSIQTSFNFRRTHPWGIIFYVKSMKSEYSGAS